MSNQTKLKEIEEIQKAKIDENKDISPTLNFENSPFKINGIINRKYYFFTPLAALCLVNTVVGAIFYHSVNNTIINTSCIIGLCLYATILYISTYKRTADILGHNKNIVFKTFLYCLPIACLYPLFCRGKISPAKNEEENTKIKKFFWQIDGSQDFKTLIFNSAIILMLGLGVHHLVNFVFNTPWLKLSQISRPADIGALYLSVALLFIFNIEKFINYKKNY